MKDDMCFLVSAELKRRNTRFALLFLGALSFLLFILVVFSPLGNLLSGKTSWLWLEGGVIRSFTTLKPEEIRILGSSMGGYEPLPRGKSGQLCVASESDKACVFVGERDWGLPPPSPKLNDVEPNIQPDVSSSDSPRKRRP